MARPALALLAAAAAAVASGVLTVLALPPHNWSVLAYCSLVPLLLVSLRSSPTKALFLGWLGLAGAMWLACPWLPAVTRSAGFSTTTSLAAALLVVVWHGLPHGVWLAAGTWLHSRFRLAPAIAYPLSIAAIEACFPQFVDFRLGTLLADQPALSQWAELGGCSMVSGVTVLCNVAIVAAFSGQAGWKMDRFAPALVLFAMACVGLARSWNVGLARSKAIAVPTVVMNTNRAHDHPDETALTARLTVDGMRQATSSALMAGAQLVIWPEASWPYFWDRCATTEYPATHPLSIRTSTAGNVVFGALTRASESGATVFNSAVWLGPRGRVERVHDKFNLLPFIESVPLLEDTAIVSSFRRAHPEWPRITPGGLPVVRASPDGLRLGLLVCSEELEPSSALRQVRQGANLLIGISSDSWVDDCGVAGLHMALARLRAIETRRDYVRAANGGFSCVVSATGSLIVAASIAGRAGLERGFLPEQVLCEVRLLDIASPGPWTVPLFPSVCAIALTIAVMVRLRRRQESLSEFTASVGGEARPVSLAR